MADISISALDASRQVAFHQLLVSARKTWLIDALSETLSHIDPIELKQQLLTYIPPDIQQMLARAGIRDEHVFPTPIILEAAPTLVGYYRLLLGIPQKTFYGKNTGMGRFKSMEVKGLLNARHKARIPAFCQAMSQALAELIRQLSPSVTSRDIAELPLLTLGSSFQGAKNVIIGQKATRAVFLAITAIVEEHITARTAQQLSVTNASGRQVLLTLGSDPDVSIEEEFAGQFRKKVAIEIKGGTDASNAYNRAGEAEKSHQKAEDEGFRDFWTIIAKKGVNFRRLQQGSQTTRSWFDAAQVLGQEGEDWREFQSRIADAVGIPLI